MPNIFNIVLPTFSVILIGYLFSRFRKINVASITDITLYIGVPALVFVSLIKQKIVLVEAAKIWVASLIIMFGCFLIAWIAFKILKQKHSGLYLPISIMNTVNIPFPIISLAYGATGMVAATLFYIPNSLIVFSIGTYMVSGGHWKENIKEIFRQPAVYASIIGLLVNFLNIPVPELLISALDFIAMMAIPLVLFILGYNLSQSRMTTLPTTLLASFIRMGVGLGIGLMVVQVLDITGVFRSVVIFYSAMPAAAIVSILATKYDNEADLVSSVVFVTTLASLVVVPLLLQMLG